jgi:hypothetical protein
MTKPFAIEPCCAQATITRRIEAKAPATLDRIETNCPEHGDGWCHGPDPVWGRLTPDELAEIYGAETTND